MDAECIERQKLAEAVSSAAKATFRAKEDVDLATWNAQDTLVCVQQLTEARSTEREALAAFSQHRKTHDC
jgi:hypothetical protein